ncbi:MAG: DUF805 domain-containing protein [Acidobacteriaceae bacterium]|nr:DUF805 domain-containing protein [Acidobacteriaceae bacterium]
MTFTESIKTCFAKYARFKGRASRSEYWWFQLFGIAFYLAAYVPGLLLNKYPIIELLSCLAWLAIIVPSVSVMVRRLHDTEHSGWCYWLGFIPIVGAILLIWTCRRGTDGENQYGPDPFIPFESIQPEIQPGSIG